MKRIVPLLAMALLLLGSINVSAACFRCRFITDTCASGQLYTACDDSSGTCIGTGECPAARAAAATPLATQWTVASVERLDEPHAATTAVKTARLEPKPVRNR